MTCKHKTFHDHTLHQLVDGKSVWVCSACGKDGFWSDSWAYWGSIECAKCGFAAMESVACSTACAEKLGFTSQEPPPKVNRKKAKGHSDHHIASSVLGLNP